MTVLRERYVARQPRLVRRETLGYGDVGSGRGQQGRPSTEKRRRTYAGPPFKGLMSVTRKEFSESPCEFQCPRLRRPQAP
jgi:hypothetical protein